MGTQNKAAQQAPNAQAANGARDNLKGTIQLGGVSLKVADLIDILEAPTTAAAATDKAKAAYSAAVAAERTVRAKARATRLSLENYLVAIHGEDSTVLAEFGFAVKKAVAKTVEVKAEAAQKMRATRKARGTMGKKQKPMVKGTVVVDATALAALQPAALSAAPTTATPTGGKTGNS